MSRKSRAKPPSTLRCFNSPPEVIRVEVMIYVGYLQQVALALFAAPPYLFVSRFLMFNHRSEVYQFS